MCNIMLNSVRQHNCFIAQSNYIGYMFRLLVIFRPILIGLVTSCYAYIGIQGIHNTRSYAYDLVLCIL